MRKAWVAVAAAGLGILALGVYSSIPVHAAGDSQVFSPARFALVEGSVNVGMQQSNGLQKSEQKAMFKVDTMTGQVWVLQLSVTASNDPTVQSAVWAPVSNPGDGVSFQPFGGAKGMSGMGGML